MQIFKASTVGVFLIVLSIVPVALFAFEGEEPGQNRRVGVTVIRQGAFDSDQSIVSDRSELSSMVFGFRTVAEKETQEHNEKRLAHYKPRLEKYVPPKGEVSILVTGYSSTPDQTDGDPFTTASGTTVHKGTMACPAQYPFGTKISIQGRGSYICEDRGGKIKGNHFDMWFESREEALLWGKRTVVATIEK